MYTYIYIYIYIYTYIYVYIHTQLPALHFPDASARLCLACSMGPDALPGQRVKAGGVRRL